MSDKPKPYKEELAEKMRRKKRVHRIFMAMAAASGISLVIMDFAGSALMFSESLKLIVMLHVFAIGTVSLIMAGVYKHALDFMSLRLLMVDMGESAVNTLVESLARIEDRLGIEAETSDKQNTGN